MKKLKNTLGFTLVELITVVAILGVLAAVGVPAFEKAIASSELRVCSSEMESIKTAVQKAIDIDEYTFNFGANNEVIAESGILGRYIDHLDEMSCPAENHNYIIHSSRKIYCPYHDIYSSLIRAPIITSGGSIDIGDVPTTPTTPTTPEHTHSYTSVVTAPNCTSTGFTTYTCECGDTYTGNETDALGHDYQVASVTEAVCNKDGFTLYACSRCGNEYTETIPATGEHTYRTHNNRINYECYSCSDSVHTCTVCGESGSHTYTKPDQYYHACSVCDHAQQHLKGSAFLTYVGYVDENFDAYKCELCKYYPLNFFRNA